MKYIFLLLAIINFITIVIEKAGTGCGLGEIGVNKIKMGKILLAIDNFELDCPNVSLNKNIITILTLKEYKDACFQGPYLRKKDIVDVYGNNYNYFSIKGVNTVFSNGLDGIFGNKDDQNFSLKKQTL